QEYDYYIHQDSFAILWQVSRSLRDPESQWQASAHQLKSEGADMVLLRGNEPLEMLAGLAELVKLADWLRLKGEQTNCLASLVDIKQPDSGKIDIRIRCKTCGNVGVLKVESFDLVTESPELASFKDGHPDSIPAITGLLEDGVCPVCSIWRENPSDRSSEGDLP